MASISTHILHLILYLSLLFPGSNGDILFGTNSVSTQKIDISVTIDTTTNIVDIVLVGPSDRWFGVGWGTDAMSGAYAFVISSFVSEYKITKGNGGSALDPQMITILSDTSDSGKRTVMLQRARVGLDTDYYTFPTTPQTIDIIYAFESAGTIPYNYHGGGDPRGCMYNLCIHL